MKKLTKNFTLQFQPVPSRSRRLGDSFVGTLVWEPELHRYRISTLLRNGDPIPLMEDMPKYVWEFLGAAIMFMSDIPVIELGIEALDIDSHTEKIRELIPDAQRSTHEKAGLEMLEIRFQLKEATIGTPLDLNFANRQEVFLTQPGEVSNWAIVSYGSIIHCQTQIQAERLARQLWLANGDLYHRHPDVIETEYHCSSTDPLDGGWSLVVSDEEDSDVTATYAIDYRFIRTVPDGPYDFVVLHSAQDHGDYSDEIDYEILPFDGWEVAARNMIAEVRDLAATLNTEEYVYVPGDDTLEQMIEAMKADLELEEEGIV